MASCAASRRAVASPSPLLAPVMTTTFPSMLVSSLPVLFIADFLHPVDRLAVEAFLNGDMRHRRRLCRAVPVLFTRGKPDAVAGADLLDRTAPALRADDPRGRRQRLAGR